ncbi:MAG TPA: gluconokinase [Acidobacteriaceae bacterium]|nr:gluconokinase [Acidobacteriaceae bacterium]
MMVVLMGVTASGKTTIGTRLAALEHWEYAEGDDYHSEANKAKMHAGIPLTDADRAPWLAALHQLLLDWYRSGTSGVLACSALRQAYRDELSAGIPSAALRFVLLEVPRAVLEQRMAERKGHYMSPALLDSQIATLEMPRDAIRVAADLPPDEVVQKIVTALRATESHP